MESFSSDTKTVAQMAGQEVNTAPQRPPRRKPQQKKENPISAAVAAWLETLPSASITLALLTEIGGSVPTTAARGEGANGHADSDVDSLKRQLVEKAPKRWVVYEPMVLLPSGSFSSHPWPALLASLSSEQTSRLWTGVLREISPPAPAGSKKAAASPALTHLAINEGIPLLKAEQADSEEENLLRSPSGLKMLHGDFGPAADPSGNDFDKAFWVSTKQNGITQIWAPRWTMFSRGNVKEKARLLSFHDGGDGDGDNNHNTSLDIDGQEQQLRKRRHRPNKQSLRGKIAVDLYAGIGYFVFSYARLGMRVLGWELNPWSVEGLRRGAEANKWSVRVIKGDSLKLSTPEIMKDAGDAQIVVFLEDNAQAERRIRELRAAPSEEGVVLGDVVHVNCGFLPTSLPTWRPSWDIITQTQGERDGGSWVHLHENVGVADIERRRQEIQGMVESWRDQDGSAREIIAEHVELVKTFAPDVWHCVFDVYIGPEDGSKPSVR